MIAIVKVGGHQALVKAGENLEVDKINLEVGKKTELETLLISDEEGKNCRIGTPILEQKISAKIVEHGRGDKIRIYKMKPRKRYRRTQGHRQDYTVIEIMPFGGETKKEKPATKKEPQAKKAAPKKVIKKDDS